MDHHTQYFQIFHVPSIQVSTKRPIESDLKFQSLEYQPKWIVNSKRLEFMWDIRWNKSQLTSYPKSFVKIL
jgi:hypothetical protein